MRFDKYEIAQAITRARRAVTRLLLYPRLRHCMKMPGQSYKGPFLPLTGEEEDWGGRIKAHVSRLADDIGERSFSTPRSLAAAEAYVEGELAALGYRVSRQPIEFRGCPMNNLVVELPGRECPDQIVVVGAHLDTVENSPGADDNAAAVGVLIELARALRDAGPARTLRFCVFANEEHPGGTGQAMGSYACARRCRELEEDVVAMLSLEMLGVYSQAEGSQMYPPPLDLFYPTVGNFVAFVSSLGSLALVRRSVELFRSGTLFPSEGIALPERFEDIGRSDHWSFWQFGYEALMVTDTSNYRYRHYHTPRDTPDKLDFERLSRVAVGLAHVVKGLCERSELDGIQDEEPK